MIPGSLPSHGVLAQGAALGRGYTPLEAKLLGVFAAYGDTCWIDDTAAWSQVKHNDNRPYHRNSIGRARRNAVKKGALISERIFPQQTPKGASFPQANGTTSKFIVWRSLGLRNPLGRAEKRKLREERREAERKARQILGPPPSPGPSDRARHAPVPAVLGQIIEGRTLPLPPRAEERTRTPPPRDDRPLAERVEDAKRRLAAFDETPPKRGPP
jgi:hypothetical protein